MSAEGVAEVLREFADRHDFEDGMSKEALPTVADDFATCGWNNALKGVKEAVLSRVDGMDHGGRNSFINIQLSIESMPEKARGKMAITLDYSRSYAEN